MSAAVHARPSARHSALWLLGMLLAACTGSDDQAADTATDAAAASSVLAPEEPVEEAPASARYALGTHYQRLSPVQPTSSGPEQVEVAEIFSYACVPCYELEAPLERWLGAQAPYVSFVRIPATIDPVTRLHARAFFTAEQLGRLDEVHGAIFREIQTNGNPLDSEQALADLFGRLGVPAAAFEAAFDSYDVHDRVRRADELATRYRVERMPALVVNGKYKSDPTLADGYDELLALAEFLAASDRSGR